MVKLAPPEPKVKLLRYNFLQNSVKPICFKVFVKLLSRVTSLNFWSSLNFNFVEAFLSHSHYLMTGEK